jgi:molybdate transport system regulatory protein
MAGMPVEDEKAVMPREKARLRAGARLFLAVEHKFFGAGCAQLLKLIDKTGTIEKARLEMNMSYNKAHKLVREMERALGRSIVSRTQGGSKTGARAFLTSEGRELLERFEKLSEECAEFVNKAFEKHFAEWGE